MHRLTRVLILSALAAGTAAFAPTPPHYCHAPRPARFGTGNLYPIIQCSSFNGPKWTPIDFHLVSVPIGTPASMYSEFIDSLNTILPGPNHMENMATGGVGPGAPHSGPYTYEMAWGINDSGFFEGRDLRLSQFRDGNGALLAFLVVPQGHRGMEADEGSSPDSADGPIISNDLFPIHLEAMTIHDGSLFSNPITFDIPALDGSLTPPFNVDGHSHFPMFYADNTSFAIHPTTRIGYTGTYRYVLRMTDSEGRGWNISAAFFVVQPYQ